MMRALYTILFFVAFLLLAPPASVAVPQLTSVHGKLTDVTGNPVSGNYDFIFRIYSVESGGTALWTEYWNSTNEQVSVGSSGYFSVLLGSHTAINLPFDQQYWLSIQVANDLLSPRFKMGSVPYTYRANITENLAAGTKAAGTLNMNNYDITSAGGIYGTTLYEGGTALSSKYAQQTRTLTAGPGLSGGGTLAADRTFSINYGADLMGWTNLTSYPAGCSAGQAVQVIGDTLTCVDLSAYGNVTGTGTANYIPKWTSSSNVGASLIYDTGTNVGVGTASPAQKLVVAGDVNFTGTLQAGSVPWARLTNFPSGCSATQAVQVVGGTLTCVDVSAAATNASLMNAWNGTNWVGWLATSGGIPKIEVNSQVAQGLSCSNCIGGSEIDESTLSITNGGGWTDAGTTVQLAAGTDNVNATTLFINNTAGNVGIGTVSPSVPLHLAKDGVQASGNYYNLARFLTAAENKGVNLGYDTSGTIGIIAPVGASGILTFWNHNGTAFGERVRIDAAGNVGIGTTSPGSKLHVVGTSNVVLNVSATTDPAIRIYDTGYTSGNQTVGIASDNGDLFLVAGDDLYLKGRVADTTAIDGNLASSAQLYINGSSGNVGIGTSAPNSKLYVIGNTTVVGSQQSLQVSDGITTTISLGLATHSTAQTPYVYGNTVLALGTNGAERVRIDGNGNVGIGTASPGTKLDVTGGSGNPLDDPAYAGYLVARFNNAGAADKQAFIQVNSTSDTAGIVFKTSSNPGTDGWGVIASGNMLRIANDTGITNIKVGSPLKGITVMGNGNVGVGRQAGTYALEVQGDAGKTSGGTAWVSISDAMFKNISGGIENALGIIDKLKPIKYTWNDLYRQKYGVVAGKEMYGFTAQNVKDVIPEFVTVDKEGYLWYNPSGYEAVLTKAVQEQQKQIENLAAQNAGQEREIEALNARLAALEEKVK